MHSRLFFFLALAAKRNVLQPQDGNIMTRNGVDLKKSCWFLFFFCVFLLLWRALINMCSTSCARWNLHAFYACLERLKEKKCSCMRNRECRVKKKQCDHTYVGACGNPIPVADFSCQSLLRKRSGQIPCLQEKFPFLGEGFLAS